MPDIGMHSLTHNTTITVPAKTMSNDKIRLGRHYGEKSVAHTCYLVPYFVFAQSLMIKIKFC